MENKKSENTFDYFRSEPVVLNGRFARYADAMWTQNGIGENDFFNRLLDLVAVSAIIGLRTGKRLPDDKSSSDKRVIQLEQFKSGEYKRFNIIMQVILLIDDSRGLTSQEKAKIAFDTNPKEEEEYRENMDLFMSYVRGGIEHIYNALVLRATDPDDEVSSPKVANILEFMKNPINNTL